MKRFGLYFDAVTCGLAFVVAAPWLFVGALKLLLVFS